MSNLFRCFECGTIFEMRNEWIEDKITVCEKKNVKPYDFQRLNGYVRGWYCHFCWVRKNYDVEEGYKRYPNFEKLLIATKL